METREVLKSRNHEIFQRMLKDLKKGQYDASWSHVFMTTCLSVSIQVLEGK